MVNCRFTVAIHVLCLMAAQHPQALTSGFIAGSVNTNPVVIRRILATLRKAGWVKSQPGVNGGWELLAKPSAISLADVYRLVRPGTVFALHSKRPNPLCPVGRNIQQGLFGHYHKAQAAMEQELGQSTIGDVLRDVQAAGQ